MLIKIETESENWNFLKYGRIGKHPMQSLPVPCDISETATAWFLQNIISLFRGDQSMIKVISSECMHDMIVLPQK